MRAPHQAIGTKAPPRGIWALALRHASHQVLPVGTVPCSSEWMAKRDGGAANDGKRGAAKLQNGATHLSLARDTTASIAASLLLFRKFILASMTD